VVEYGGEKLDFGIAAASDHARGGDRILGTMAEGLRRTIIRNPEWLMETPGKASPGEALAHLFEIHAERN
jgi:hypothetical protein